MTMNTFQATQLSEIHDMCEKILAKLGGTPEGPSVSRRLKDISDHLGVEESE